MERALLERVEEGGGAGRVGRRWAFGVVDTAPREDRRGESGGDPYPTRHVGKISLQSPGAGHRGCAHRRPAVGGGLEVVLHAELCATRIAHDAAGVPLGQRLEPDVEAAEILEIEDIEQVYGDPKLGTGNLREILAQLEIQAPVSPGIRDDEAVVLGCEPAIDVCEGPTEARWAADVQGSTARQGEQPAELDSEREGHVRNPVGYHAVPLVVPAVVGMLRDPDGIGVSTGE